jgi:hypothetical protein
MDYDHNKANTMYQEEGAMSSISFLNTSSTEVMMGVVGVR